MRGDRARSALSGTRFADVRWVDETGSTNRDLLSLAAGGAPEGVVLVADHQRAGRGRLDRAWHAPSGGSLLLSILFRPSASLSDAHLLTTAVGLSAAEACLTVSGVTAGLKWPNDLVVERPDDRGGGLRKLGGILAESTVEGGELDAVVVGLGLNVNWPAELPPDLADIAVALNHVTGHEVDREDLLAALLGRLDHWYARLGAATGRAELLEAYRSRSATLGRRVRADLGREVVEGRATGFTDSGALMIEVATGAGRAERIVVAGDVVNLRPDP